jgi:hypothetical protein
VTSWVNACLHCLPACLPKGETKVKLRPQACWEVHPSYDVGLFVRTPVVQQMRLVPSPAGEVAGTCTAVLCVLAAECCVSWLWDGACACALLWRSNCAWCPALQLKCCCELQCIALCSGC